MGAGKTSWAIDYMNNASGLERFIYITPFLNEVQRIKESVTNREFIEPNNANEEGRKMYSLKKLIVSGVDIVSTHSLFQTADDELIELLTGSGYTLILDEVMDCVEPVNVKRDDIRQLLKSEAIEIVDNRVIWIGDPKDDSRYIDIRLLAQAGNLFCHRDKFFMWAFPPAVFKSFDNIFILTYLFNAQMQRYYFDLFNFEYEYKSVIQTEGRYELTEYDVKREKRDELYKLIDIYDGKMNDIGMRKNALSVAWLGRASFEQYQELRNNLYNFFHNIAKAKKDEVYFSTVKKYKDMLAPRGYKPSKSKKVKSDVFLPVNARATNEYADRRAIAYILNRYPNPEITVFFQDNGVKVEQDLLATSDLLQWIWRSRIRNHEPIQLYLPSSRMRELLKAWANYEI